MISRKKRNNSNQIRRLINSDKYCDLPEKPPSYNRYKQSKLPSRFLGKSIRKPELNFVMDHNFEARFIYREEKINDVESNENEQFIFQFKWPDLGQIVNLSCDRDLLKDLEFEYIDGSKLTKKQEDDQVIWIAILKSHLQKAIRRGKTNLALATANLMLDLCPIKLLRRLPIIMIEDVHLDLNCSSLVWLLVFFSDRFSRCFKNDQRIRLKPKIRNFILSEVFHLCQYPQKDVIKYVHDCQRKLKKWDHKLMLEKPGEWKRNYDQIYGLQLRKIYGGMKGDQEMMDQYCLKWLDQTKSLIQPEIKTIDFDHLIKLTRKNFILGAIDFHCCPWILDQLNKKTGQAIDMPVIKEIIWHTSSCINYRVNDKVSDAYTKALELFKDEWYVMAREILNKYLFE